MISGLTAELLLGLGDHLQQAARVVLLEAAAGEPRVGVERVELGQVGVWRELLERGADPLLEVLV